MKPESTEHEVKKFYEGVSLPAERADAILSMRGILAESRRWKAIGVAASLGVVLLSCVAINQYLELRSARTVIASLSESGDNANRDATRQRDTVPEARSSAIAPESTMSESRGTVPESPNPAHPASTKAYRLVSVTTHGPRCPNCGAAMGVFADLRQQFSNEAIEFVEVGLNDKSSREEHGAMMVRLGLGELLENRGESGFFLLTTADGELIERIDPLVGVERVHDDLAGRLGMR